MALSTYNLMEDVTPFYDGDDNVTTSDILQNSTGMLGNYGNETEEESAATCLVFRFTLYVCVMGVLCFMGFIGNTVSFLVLCRDRSTPVASFLLQVLAVADNLMLLFWANHFIVGYFMEFMGVRWMDLPRFMWFYRIYTYPILFIAQTETIWLTVVIALNRYMAVCLPYHAPHLCTITNVYREVISVTLFSIIYNLPRFFVMDVPQKYTNNGTINTNITVYYSYNKFGESEIYKMVYTDTLYYLVSFVLPLLILAFVNTRVTIAYQASRRRRRRMTSRRSENENNITLVMIIIVLSFMLCQAPARIVQLVWNYQYQDCAKYRFKYYLIHISNTLEALNSSINFGIYFMFRKRFRDILWQFYCIAPLASKYRRDSMRATTTEGLSLEEVRRSSKSSSQKSKSSKESQKNGCILVRSPKKAGGGEQTNPQLVADEAVPLQAQLLDQDQDQDQEVEQDPEQDQAQAQAQDQDEKDQGQGQEDRADQDEEDLEDGDPPEDQHDETEDACEEPGEDTALQVKDDALEALV